MIYMGYQMDDGGIDMYKYEYMALIIKGYLDTKSSGNYIITSGEARKLPGMDDYASNSCYQNVCRAMDVVSERYYEGRLLNPEKRSSSTFSYEYKVN